MAVTFKQLKIFEATARLGRLTAAADEQALSQSAASQSLKELESALDYRLFVRSGRELVISDSGLEVLPRIREILELVDSLKTSESAAVRGHLRVIASVTVGCYVLPKLMARFVARYPDVEPDIEIGNTRQVMERLEKGQAHVGLIEGPALHKQLQVIPWLADHLEVFCHPDHDLAASGQLNEQQISQQRWVLREQGSGTRAVFDQAIQRTGAQLNLALALNRQEAIKQSVKAGLGVGCLSCLSVAEEVAAGELVLLKTPLDLRRRFSLVVDNREQNNLTTQAFVDFLQQDSREFRH